MKTVVVIGGGITGLSTMYYLNKRVKELHKEVRLILIEADESLGGKIKTAEAGEFIMETGADSIVARKPNVAPFLEELNLQDEVVYNATGISFIYTDGKLKKIPEDTVFGIPLSLESLAKTELVSAEGKVEALKDFYTKNETFTKNDSIGEFLESFLGKELVEKQISPVISGVYSGKLHELTIASTLPYLLDYKNQFGSIIQGLSENKQVFKGTGDKKFLSFKNGVSSLIDRLETQLSGVEIWKGVRAETVAKHQGGYKIQLEDHRSIEADIVVLSTLHTTAQSLLHDEQLNDDFDQLTNSSLISIYLGFDVPDSELPDDGTGFIVADNSQLVCNACTWTSRKWEHTSKNNQLLVRLFYKSSIPAFEAMRNMTQEELIQVALRDIKISLGIEQAPIHHEVTKWNNTMPNYHINHHKIVQSLENKLTADYPNVFLAGCSYYGVGIPDCIANGEKTAQLIEKRL